MQGKNIQNVAAGGEGTQINDPQAPILQGISNSTISFNYFAKPPN
ncbi:hypothetical protein TUMEXPCC7403_12260 [Tumidithrix helvetica PCC 7403]